MYNEKEHELSHKQFTPKINYGNYFKDKADLFSLYKLLEENKITITTFTMLQKIIEHGRSKIEN